MQYSPPFQNYPLIIHHLENRLLVTTLRAILKEYGLPISGKKYILITRIREFLDKVVETKDIVQYERLKNSIMGIHLHPIPSYVVSYTSKNLPIMSSTPLELPISEPALSLPTINVFQRINFKPSPFYNILENINSPIICPPMLRNIITASVRLSLKAVEKLASNESYRVYLFCTATDSAAFGLALIEFPVHMDLKVNGKHLSANTRGLKKKPGTAPPVDVTSLLFLDSKLVNKIEIIYANTEKRYSFGVYLVQKYTICDIIQHIKAGRCLSKQTILDTIKKDSEDGDIIATSYDISLKDPISYTRIELPCRSIYCNHVQCFDAYSFLTLNEQTPTWQCPICNKPIHAIDDLAIDSYTLEILNSVSLSVESVTIDLNGTWFITKSNIGNELSDSNNNEDISKKHNTFYMDPNNHETSLEQNHSVLSSSKSLYKRSEPTVIDLTLDSDDESPMQSPLHKKCRNNSVDTQSETLSSDFQFPKFHLNLASISHLPKACFFDSNVSESGHPISTDIIPVDQSLNNSVKLSTLESEHSTVLYKSLADNNTKDINNSSAFLGPFSNDLWSNKDNSCAWQEEFRENNCIDIHSTHS
ncbi:hypothetical protein PNEG_03472 [Pneumocystis murina B123]|uniref:Uncharacterized protein n=1 Tax=Pneumocystis murina (strain B123) TaxID=1069680 RepID=M7NHI9_PNEMU|nr:hypothetical protein PNEG_03472 [Pneumocystis murina B123]EMR08028.1 hypothetical protein PNEG_03472 [Pneumocystis murina B123]